MSLRTTWIWLAIVAGILGSIVFLHKPADPGKGEAALPFPRIDPDRVESIQVRPGKEMEIRVVRTNGTWHLAEPLDWPADEQMIETFLSSVAKAEPATYITPAEVRARPNAEQEYGLDDPRASVIIRQGSERLHLLIGANTPPGDQFLLQVIGLEGVHVFNLEFLKSFPTNINQWRDTAVVDLNKTPPDSVSVTNGSKVFSLQRDETQGWRMVFPIQARADQARIHDALERIHSLRMQQFVTDDPGADLEAFGLMPPMLHVTLRSRTNPPVHLQFGKSPTNAPDQVFARKDAWKSVVTVAKAFIEPFQDPINSFRDPFLLTGTAPVQSIVSTGKEPFTLVWEEGGRWTIAPSNWPGDPDLAREFIGRLTSLRIAQFVKDVVTAPDLPGYGLAPPSRAIQIRFAEAGDATNQIDLHFGAEQDGKIFARRTDEASIYALSTNQVDQLASAPWELRQRRLWTFTLEDLQGLSVQADGRTRRLLRQGAESWQLAPGSQGSINDLAVEETVRGLSTAAMDKWVALGAEHRERFGIDPAGVKLSFELKDGRVIQVEFGRPTPSQGAYAAVTLDGLVWIGEFPWIFCRDIIAHLAPPSPATSFSR